ncbi:MAG: hypothetical protein AB7F19_04175 [Candidatus Babeliales bacterium]
MQARMFFVVLVCIANLQANVFNNSSSSYPYISGHTFRACCNHVIPNMSSSFRPEAVKDGDTVFLCGDFLKQFFLQYHPRIRARYILITHDTIHNAPGIRFKKFLSSQTLAFWFGKNTNMPDHPKMISIPIGLANNHWKHGKTALFDQVIKEINKGKIEKNTLLYMNFERSTYKSERDIVYDYFKDKPFCTIAQRKPTIDYLRDLASSKFVLSPRGSGVDCHRTWEALLMGSYPIVISSFLDVLFEDLPVVIIQDWQQITPDFLKQKYQEFAQKQFNMEKCYMPYWLDLIAQAQEDVRASCLAI